MGTFSMNAYGFWFTVCNIVLATIIFIVALIPGEVCNPIVTTVIECVKIPTFWDNVMTGLFVDAIISIAFNVIWAVLQRKPLCQWSSLEFHHETDVAMVGEGGMVIATRKWSVPRFIPTLTAGAGFAITAIIAAVKTGDYTPYGKVVPVWAVGTFFGFAAAVVYIVETVVMLQCKSKYNGT